jgi:hypothetical protein
MMRRITVTAILLVLCFAASQMVWAAQPGMTGTVFNKRFIGKIKPAMPYEQIVKITGAPGLKVADGKAPSQGIVRYQWKGGKESVLRARFTSGRMIDATVLAPNGHTYSIRQNGEVVDLGD